MRISDWSSDVCSSDLIQRTHRWLMFNPSEFPSMTTKTALPVQQRTLNRVRGRDYILPACVALACAGAAFAGADTTFDPALTKFTDFLEGSGGKIIPVLCPAGGLIGLAQSDTRRVGKEGVINGRS